MNRRGFFKLLGISPALTIVRPRDKVDLPIYGRSLAADLERIANDPYFISTDKYPDSWKIKKGEIGRWMNTRYMYWGNKIVPMKK